MWNDVHFKSIFDAILLKPRWQNQFCQGECSRTPRRIEIERGEQSYPMKRLDYYKQMCFESIDSMANAFDHQIFAVFVDFQINKIKTSASWQDFCDIFLCKRFNFVYLYVTMRGKSFRQTICWFPLWLICRLYSVKLNSVEGNH